MHFKQLNKSISNIYIYICTQEVYNNHTFIVMFGKYKEKIDIVHMD